MTTSTPLRKGRWVKPAVMVAVTLIMTAIFTTTLYAGVFGDIIDSALNVLVSWVADGIAAIIGFFLDGFMAALGTDLSVVLKAVPGLQSFHTIITGIGIGLLCVIALFQLFATFGAGVGIESEHPGFVVARMLLAGLMTIGGAQLCKSILGFLSYPYFLLITRGGLDGSNSGLTQTLKTNLTTGVNGGSKTITTIIGTILLVIVAWNLMKLVIESVKRYVYTGILVYLSPLAFSTMASKSTQRIAGSYVSMFMGHSIMSVLNVWCVAMVVNAVGAYSSFMNASFSITNPAGSNISIQPTFFLWTLIVLAVIKFGMGLEETLNKVGLHTTGSRQLSGSVMMGAAALMRMMSGSGRRHGGGGGNAGKPGGGIAGRIGSAAGQMYENHANKGSYKRDGQYQQAVADGAAPAGSPGSTTNKQHKHSPAANKEQTQAMAQKGNDGYYAARGQFNDLAHGKNVAGMQNTMNNIDSKDKDAIKAAKNLNMAAGDTLKQFNDVGGNMDLNKVHGVTPNADGSMSVYASAKGPGNEGKLVRADITTDKDFALKNGYKEMSTTQTSGHAMKLSSSSGAEANPRQTGTFIKTTTVSADSVIQKSGRGSVNLAQKSYKNATKK